MAMNMQKNLTYHCPHRTHGGSLMPGEIPSKQAVCAIPASNASIKALQQCCGFSSKIVPYDNGCYELCEIPKHMSVGEVNMCIGDAIEQYNFQRPQIRTCRRALDNGSGTMQVKSPLALAVIVLVASTLFTSF